MKCEDTCAGSGRDSAQLGKRTNSGKSKHVGAGGEGLLALAAHLGVAREETIAFGDGLNDLSMIRDAGIGVAMANARSEAKKLADVITLSCDEDGVAHGINTLCF